MSQGIRLKKRWSGLSTKQQFALLTLACVQVSLAATAWVDLARRPAAEIRGSKRFWAPVIAINWVGPLTYLSYGVRR